MKDILLLAGVSLFMTVAATFPAARENVVELALPEVQITAKRTVPEIQLPAVTIRAAKVVPIDRSLPEVVIIATKLRKA